MYCLYFYNLWVYTKEGKLVFVKIHICTYITWQAPYMSETWPFGGHKIHQNIFNKYVKSGETLIL